MAGLTEEQRAMLDFERRPWHYHGSKHAAVRERFGVSLDTYQRRLNALLDQPEALAYAPAAVRRLRRLRQRRLAARREGRAAV